MNSSLKNMSIPALAYFINTLDSRSSGCGRGRPNNFKVGDLFKKYYVPHSMPNFEKKSHPIRPVEGLKLCLDFYVIRALNKKSRQSLKVFPESFRWDILLIIGTHIAKGLTKKVPLRKVWDSSLSPPTTQGVKVCIFLFPL